MKSLLMTGLLSFICLDLRTTTALSSEHHRRLSDFEKPQEELFDQKNGDYGIVKSKIKVQPVSE